MSDVFSFASRRLSDYETVFDLLRTRGEGVICHVMIVRTRTPITRAKLEHALRTLLRHQPSLRMRVATERGARGLSKRFVDRSPEDSIVVTEAENPINSWELCVQDELQRPFAEPEGALWRLLYMDVSRSYPESGSLAYAIICKISNVIADHVSLYLMMTRQLRMVLIGSQLSANCTICKIPLHVKPSVDQCFQPAPGKSAAPPVGKPAKKSRGAGGGGGCIGRRKRKSLDRTCSVLSDDFSFLDRSDLMEPTPRTRLLRHAFRSSDAQRLERLCRKHGATVQCAFAVACAHAHHIARRIQRRGDVDADADVRVCLWLDLRRYHSAPSDCDPLGMWLCPLYAKLRHARRDPQHGAFWRRVGKLAASLEPDQEPWKQGFHDFKRCLDRVAGRPDGAPTVPRAHVAVSYLETSLDTEDDLYAMARARFGEIPQGFDPIVVQEYHATSSVTSYSVSQIHVTVVRNKNNISCVVARDDNSVPFAFAEKFLAILSKIISKMVRSGFSARMSTQADYSSAKLPASHQRQSATVSQ